MQIGVTSLAGVMMQHREPPEFIPFLQSAKKHDVNPYEWLKYVLEDTQNIKHKNIRDLYPQNYKKRHQEKIC